MRKENADTRQCNNRNDELKHGTILKQSVSLLIETLDAVLFQDDFVRAEFGFVQPIFEPERCFVADCNSRDTLNLTDIASSLRPLKTRNPYLASLIGFWVAGRPSRPARSTGTHRLSHRHEVGILAG